MIILQYNEIFFRLTALMCPGMAAGADIVILSFCNIIKGQANYYWVLNWSSHCMSFANAKETLSIKNSSGAME